MTPPTPNGSARLRSEILDEARRQRDEILQRARAESDRLIARAQQEAEGIAERLRTEAKSEAKRRHQAFLATIPVETNRLRLDHVEATLNSIREAVLEQVRSGSTLDRREALVALTAQALTRMNGNRFVLRVSPGELGSLGEGLTEALRRRWARPWLALDVVGDPEVKLGCWVLSDEEGRELWDLGLEARLKRMWPDLRHQIATQAELAPADSEKGKG